MRRALELAEKGRGWTSPNPMVGAVIVKNGKIISEGYHHRVGRDHAERVALKKAGEKARGATLYVTLEPCCHTGRTAPCTDAIIAAGIKKVVYAVTDPDPRVNGKGARVLEKAGIIVERGLLRREATVLNEMYFGYHKNRRPFILLKTAQTLDGKIATVTGESQWISNVASRRFCHRLRSEVDGVVVGMGTVRVDNPALTVRLVKGRNPYRIVLSRSLQFPPSTQLLSHNDDSKTIIASTAPAIERFLKAKRRYRGLIYWELKTGKDGLLDLHDFVRKAHEFGLHSLMVEGGSSLAASFLKAGLVDKFVVAIAPMVLGSGIDAIGDMNIKKISHAVAFERVSFHKSGTDRIFIGYPKKKET